MKEAVYVLLEKGVRAKIHKVNKVLFSSQSTADYVRKCIDQNLGKHVQVMNRKLMKLNGGNTDAEQ